MAGYRNLRSVAHNLGYSFLSDMNAVGADWQIVPEHVWQKARAERIEMISIDLLRRKIEPPPMRTPLLVRSVENYSRMLGELLTKQGSDLAMVAEASLSLRFDAERTGRTADGLAEIPVLECVVEITDDRGIVHVAQPRKWWRS